MLIKAECEHKRGERTRDINNNAQPFGNIPERWATDFGGGTGEFGHEESDG